MRCKRKPRNLSAVRLLMKKKFHARTFEEVDGRRTTVKTLRRTLDRLLKEGSANNIQKELLCKRAAFMAMRLESMEAEAADGKDIDMGIHVALSNALKGLLNVIFAKKSMVAKGAVTLDEYLKRKKPK